MKTSVSAKRKGHTELEFAFVPVHFRKNYEHPSLLNDSYVAANAHQFAIALAHTNRLWRKVDWEIGASYGRRDFSTLFDTRDRNVIKGKLGLRRKLRKRVHVIVEFGLGKASYTEGFEEGIEIDRSFSSWKMRTGLDAGTGLWTTQHRIEYRVRDYDTANRQDLARFGRRDSRWAFKSKVGRELGANQRLWAQFRYLSNSSNRPGDVSDPDIVPYDNLEIGLGVEREF